MFACVLDSNEEEVALGLNAVKFFGMEIVMDLLALIVVSNIVSSRNMTKSIIELWFPHVFTYMRLHA